MQLTPEQKLQALSYRFYSGVKWDPKEGDYYTTSRADLEVYQVVSIKGDVIETVYTENGTGPSFWPTSEFLTEGFGPKRVWVPDFILNL